MTTKLNGAYEQFGDDARFMKRQLGNTQTLASANNITLTTNSAYITGNTDIKTITTSGWQAGTPVIWQFDDVCRVMHNQTPGGGQATILLSIGCDWTSYAGAILKGVIGQNGLELTPDYPAVLTPLQLGDGSDGDVTIAADTDVVRTMYYNNLTIQAGKVLRTNGLRIYILGTLNLEGTAKITDNGVDGTSAAGFDSGLGGAGSSENGSNPADGTTGAPAQATVNVVRFGMGGNGGSNGDSGAGTSGYAVAIASVGSYLMPTYHYMPDFGVRIEMSSPPDNSRENDTGGTAGISGAAGGGDSATQKGGGGGGGGGSPRGPRIFANIINNQGTISANGGRGGNGGDGETGGLAGTYTGGGSGGGGGGAGCVYVACNSYNGAGVLSANGGEKGNGGHGWNVTLGVIDNPPQIKGGDGVAGTGGKKVLIEFNKRSVTVT